jgi:hypothetical protein
MTDSMTSKDVLSLDDVALRLSERFTSGNVIPVEGAQLTREEGSVLLAGIELLKQERDSLAGDVDHSIVNGVKLRAEIERQKEIVVQMRRLNCEVIAERDRLRAVLEQVHTQADQWLDNPLATGTRVIERIEKLAREALESSAPETAALLPGEDIAEALERRGDPLSLRAARYIRIKWNSEEGMRDQLRHANDRLNAQETAVCTHGAMSPELCRVCTPGESR